jgi:hypothetical protein
MPKWTNEEYNAYLDRRKKPAAKPKPAAVHEPLGKNETASRHPRRYKVCVVSFRTRLTDPDNLCAKYHIDGLRYSGGIDDDTSQHIELVVSQKKVGTKAEECTLISIVPLP